MYNNDLNKDEFYKERSIFRDPQDFKIQGIPSEVQNLQGSHV